MKSMRELNAAIRKAEAEEAKANRALFSVCKEISANVDLMSLVEAGWLHPHSFTPVTSPLSYEIRLQRGAVLWDLTPDSSKPKGESGYHPAMGPRFDLAKVMAPSAPLFVVNHNWTSTLSNIEGYGGDVMLPFQKVIFEFELQGVRFVAAVDAEETGGLLDQASISFFFRVPIRDIDTGRDPEMWKARQSHKSWRKLMDNAGSFWVTVDLKYFPLEPKVREHIRAICLALEIEVAETRQVHVPSRVKERRRREGKHPLVDYTMVEVAARHVAAPRAPGDPEPKAPSVRWHIRRGHIRHYAPGKSTWVKAHKVGDASLGIVLHDYKVVGP